jgi:hypothetical protein
MNKLILPLVLSTAIIGCNGKSIDLKVVNLNQSNTENSTGNEFGFIATEASSRMIAINLSKGRLCAEPPPETQVTESTTFQLLLDSAKKIEGNNPSSDNARAQLYRTYSEALNQLYKRSHSNQLYRDASYYLCQAHLNGALTKDATASLMSILSLGSEVEAANTKELFTENEIKIMDSIVGGAYLVAQMKLSKMAFDSLQYEVAAFYISDTAEQKGKAEAIKNFQAMINKTQANIDLNIQNSLNATQGKLNESLTGISGNKITLDKNFNAIGDLKTDIGKIPTK